MMLLPLMIVSPGFRLRARTNSPIFLILFMLCPGREELVTEEGVVFDVELVDYSVREDRGDHVVVPQCRGFGRDHEHARRGDRVERQVPRPHELVGHAHD